MCNENQISHFDAATVGINGIALLSPLTGIGQYTFHLVRELQQLLPEAPWLFYAAEWSQEIRTTPFKGAGGIKKLIRHCIPRSYEIARFLLQRSFSKGVRRHKLNLYHEPNFLAYRYQGPTAVTVHDLSWVRHPETHPVERVRIMNRLMPEVVARADHLLADSAFVRDEIIHHYGVAPEKVSTVLLGASAAFVRADAASCAHVLSGYGLQYGRYILAVGTLEPRKNLSTVIAAYAQLPQSVRRHYPLVIAGMQGWGNDLIAKNQVILTGYVPQKDLPSLYAGARAFVYPSLYEGFGLPPLEAMACGVPVIASNRASLPEVVGNAGILIEPLDDVVLAQHMQSLIEDDALHQRLSLAGETRAQQFTWRQCALDTLAVYAKVLQQQ